MGTNILREYLDYIKSIPDDQLFEEMIESGIENYLVDDKDLVEDNPPYFVSSEKVQYDIKETKYEYKHFISTESFKISNFSNVTCEGYLERLIA